MTALFIDASAVVALLSGEPEDERISAVLADAEKPFTTALAVLEAALALSRPDKWNVPIAQVEPAMLEIIEQRGIGLVVICPPMSEIFRSPRRASSCPSRPLPDIEVAVMASILLTAYTTPRRDIIARRFSQLMMNSVRLT